MKILIVEDDPIRMVEFHKILKSDVIHHATDAEAGIEYLKSDIVFDLVMLDHDLADEHYANVNRTPEAEASYAMEGTGQDVARYMAAMTNPPPFVFIHSWNPTGAKAMEDILRDSEISTFRAPFGSADLKRGLIQYRAAFELNK